MSAFPIPDVRAVITDDEGHVLLLQRAMKSSFPGIWTLPGGKVDIGYSVEDTMKKELLEETSLECANCEFLFFVDNLPNDEYADHYITFFFRCSVEGKIILNDESEAYKWIGLDELADHKIAFRQDVSIRRILSQGESR